MSKVKKLGIIGFGTVGSGVYETLQVKKNKVENLIGGPFQIPVILVKDRNKTREVPENILVTDSFNDLIKQEELDAVVEAAPDAETAYPYVKQLLDRGITVITANKELVAKHGEELLELASQNSCRLFFEAAVAGGIPVLTSIRHTLKTNDVERIEGIVNGTSNFILSKMRTEGTAFSTALQEAQQKGYAEAVPDKDIDGWDASFKTTILSQWIYGQAPVWHKSEPEGIREIDVRDLHLAASVGGRIKHLATLELNGEQIHASVRPHLVTQDHPLYGVEGVNNGIHLKGSIVGSLLFQGPGAGKFPTASAIVEELVNSWTGTDEQIPDYKAVQNEREISKQKAAKQKKQLWFVTGKELALQLENRTNLTARSEIWQHEQKEAAVISGEEQDITDIMTAFNPTVSIYPVCGEVIENLALLKIESKSEAFK